MGGGAFGFQQWRDWSELVIAEEKDRSALRFLFEDKHTRVPAPLDYSTFRKRFSKAMLLRDIQDFRPPFRGCFDC